MLCTYFQNIPIDASSPTHSGLVPLTMTKILAKKWVNGWNSVDYTICTRHRSLLILATTSSSHVQETVVNINDINDIFNMYLAEPGIFINIHEYTLSDSQKDDDDHNLIKFIRNIILRRDIFVNVEVVYINIENDNANLHDFTYRLINI